MGKKVLLGLFSLMTVHLSADWGSIGGQIEGIGTSVGGFLVNMGEGMAGKVPSGYDYSFQVFNGANTSAYVDIHKSISVMGMRVHQGGGASQGIASGTDTGDSFSGSNRTHLYFSLEISCGGSSYSDPHFTLGIKNDPTIYFYHCFNNSFSGTAYTELLGAGYTVGSGFSGRIQNKTKKQASVTYTLKGSDTRIFIIDDLDPDSFNFLTIPQGYSIRPSNLFFGPHQKIIIPALGIVQVTDPVKKTSTPVTMNYVLLNDTKTGAFETGIGPGNFEQPATTDQIRDITPVQCQIYNQPAVQASPIGTLLPQALPSQSLWCVYEGSGWSQEKSGVVKTPMWQIPAGANASCFFIRPAQTKKKPARFFMVRLFIPEKPSDTHKKNAHSFLSKLIAGGLTIKGLSASQNGSLITQDTAAKTTLINGMSFPSKASFSATNSFVVYPSFSDTYLSSTITLSSLTNTKKAELLNVALPDDVGLLEDSETGVQGYLLATDALTSYGTGGGPFYYLINPPYVDMGQMLGTLINYASMCNYKGLTADLYNTMVQSFLPQTIGQWVSGYVRNPLQVEDSVASFLVLLGQGDATKLTQAFSSDASFYVQAGAKKQLSPQGNALLKMLLYGPCSISQAPVYHKAGSTFMSAQSGWPAVTLSL